MTQKLEGIFAELGLSRYLDAFVDQGFDSWDIILDIQESDLDALGVKLGHRRKLQRCIANARGIAPSVSLASVKPAVDDGKLQNPRRERSRVDASSENHGVAKRKYRRHPKPDEDAPERPPSAYVLFSNKMREDLKGQNLTFTEIAKLVGENWQSLDPAEKEAYESQANRAKEQYHRSLAEYKKTPEYRKYSQYLQDFKEKQMKQKKGYDASKRPKLEPARLRHGSTSSSATPGGLVSSGTRSGSSSERQQGSEPPPSRQERVNSTPSMAGSQHSSTAPSTSLYHGIDDTGPSPRSSHFDSESPRELFHGHSHRQSSWSNRTRTDHQQLPSLSDMLDDGKRGVDASMTDACPYPPAMGASGQTRLVGDGPAVLPPARVPVLRHEPSSGSIAMSASSSGSFGRMPGEGPLPIHALLADRTTPGAPELEKQPLMPKAIGVAAKAATNRNPALGLVQGPWGYGFQAESSPFKHARIERSGEDVIMTTVDAGAPARNDGGGSSKGGFDGMNALLRAGEIVGRRSRQ